MYKVISYAGGLLGSFALFKISFTGTILGGLEPLFDIVSVLGLVVFSGALIWEGTRALIRRG